MKHLLLCFWLFFIATAGYGQTYYVSETGDDDTNDGSRDSPFQTISFAVAQANAVDEDEVSVFIFPGAYTDSTVTIMRPMSIGRAPEDESTDTVAITLQPDATTLFDINDSSGLVSINNLALLGNANATGMAVNNSESLNITNNTFQDFAQAIQFNDSDFSEIQVQGNTFQTSTTDIVIGPTVANLDSLLVNSNRFDYPAEGNVSISNQTDLVVNAEYNWWGTASADSVAGAVSDNNIDYSPWLNLGNDADEFDPGFQGNLFSVTLGGGPAYDLGRNELQEAYDQDNTQELRLLGDTASYTALNATKPITLVIPEVVSIGSVSIGQNEVSVDGKLLIDDSLILEAGDIVTLGDSSEVVLGTNVTIPGEANGRMIGTLSIEPRIAGTKSIQGVLGVTIGEGEDSLGTISVTRINGEGAAVQSDSGESINTRWIIDTENELTSPRQISFVWRIEDNNGKQFDELNAVVWRLPDGEDQNWESVGGDPSTATPSGSFRSISVMTDKLSTWTVSDINSPLPVILTSFTARQEESTVYLAWSTASEINSDYFQIERSPDGTNFKTLSRQPAAGDSQQELIYRYTDEGAANRFSGTLYYRLRMVDFDGSLEYSDITAVALNQRPGLRVHANRANGEIKLFADWKENRYTVQVADMLGRVLLEAPLQVSEDQDYTFSLSSLSPAVYVLRCIGVLDVQTSKFRVE